MKKIIQYIKGFFAKANVMPSYLFCVVADTNGAHEAECVYSIWTTKEDAEREIEILEMNNVSAGCYGGNFFVKEVEPNKSYDVWIG